MGYGPPGHSMPARSLPRAADPWGGPAQKVREWIPPPATPSWAPSKPDPGSGPTPPGGPGSGVLQNRRGRAARHCWSNTRTASGENPPQSLERNGFPVIRTAGLGDRLFENIAAIRKRPAASGQPPALWLRTPSWSEERMQGLFFHPIDGGDTAAQRDRFAGAETVGSQQLQHGFTAGEALDGAGKIFIGLALPG